MKNLDGPNVKSEGSHLELIEALRRDIEDFKRKNSLTRCVMVWCASTEAFLAPGEIHQSLRRFEKGLKDNDPTIAPSMIYAYAAITSGIPFINGAPNLTVDIPALMELAGQNHLPIAGKDFKTGQTLMKTILAPGFKARMLGLQGWFSTNILGNRDGEVLDDSESFKTKEESKLGVLRLHPAARSLPRSLQRLLPQGRASTTTRPGATTKEGWDNIDIFGWLGYPMQIKVDFLCRDSILAAPIVLDLVLFIDLAASAGMQGHPGMALLLLQEPAVRAGALPGARSLHPADEAEKHPSLSHG